MVQSSQSPICKGGTAFILTLPSKLSGSTGLHWIMDPLK